MPATPKYPKCSQKAPCKYGTRIQVWKESALQTSGGLTKDDLMYVKRGNNGHKLVSKKAHNAAKQRYRRDQAHRERFETNRAPNFPNCITKRELPSTPFRSNKRPRRAETPQTGKRKRATATTTPIRSNKRPRRAETPQPGKRKRATDITTPIRSTKRARRAETPQTGKRKRATDITTPIRSTKRARRAETPQTGKRKRATAITTPNKRARRAKTPKTGKRKRVATTVRSSKRLRGTQIQVENVKGKRSRSSNDDVNLDRKDKRLRVRKNRLIVPTNQEDDTNDEITSIFGGF